MDWLIRISVIVSCVFTFLKLLAFFIQTKKAQTMPANSRIVLLLIGFLSNLADTLGIGSFAVVVALNSRWKLIDDRRLPGTLNAHSLLPAMVQSLLFLNVVEIDRTLLVTFILSSCVGGFLSGLVVSRLPKQTIRLWMCIGFVTIGLLILANQWHLLPIGGTAITLSMTKMLIGIFAMLIAGMLPAIGTGLYVPIQIILFLLGLSPLVAFPIMTTAGAIVQATTAYAFISKKDFLPEASVLMNISGIAGVAVAVPLVTLIDPALLRWLLLGIVAYNAVGMMRAYRSDNAQIAEA